jgi:hypothetical protein
VRATLPPIRAAAADWQRQQQQQQQQQQQLGDSCALNGSSAGDAQRPAPAGPAAALAQPPEEGGALAQRTFTPAGLAMLLWGINGLRRHTQLPEAWREAMIAATMRTLAAAANVQPELPPLGAPRVAAVAGFYPHERRRAAPGVFAAAELPCVLYYMLRAKASPPGEWVDLYTQVGPACGRWKEVQGGPRGWRQPVSRWGAGAGTAMLSVWQQGQP